MNFFNSLIEWPTYRFILVAVFLTGLAHIAFLPPFEGFDETAHWSSISIWGHEGRMPIYGEDLLDKAVRDYDGPLPYVGEIPYGQNGLLTYQSFDPLIHAGPHQTSPPQKFEQLGGINWQAQHPPLYYILLQPVFKVFNGLDWASQFFALRVTSWIFAFSGLVIGIEASRSLFSKRDTYAPIIMASWPFLVPQFFPEMARIGNDSLCLLCCGIAWLALVRLEKAEKPLLWSIILGVALGAGLWTKAFFVPISAGLVLYFAWRFVVDRKNENALNWMKFGGTALSIAGLIGAGWYIYKLMVYGNAIGGDEMLQFSKEGGVIVNFLDQVTIPQLIKGYASIVASFVYVGSWSLARTPLFLLYVPIAMLIVCAVHWMWKLKSGDKIFALPFFMAIPILAGLSYHLSLRIALDGIGSGTPGWYFHILAPALATGLAYGWPRHWSMNFFLIFGLCFTAYAWFMQLALFSGCTFKNIEKDRVEFDPAVGCFVDFEKLSALSYPLLGGVFLVLAAGFAVFGLLRWKTNG